MHGYYPPTHYGRYGQSNVLGVVGGTLAEQFIRDPYVHAGRGQGRLQEQGEGRRHRVDAGELALARCGRCRSCDYELPDANGSGASLPGKEPIMRGHRAWRAQRPYKLQKRLPAAWERPLGMRASEDELSEQEVLQALYGGGGVPAGLRAKKSKTGMYTGERRGRGRGKGMGWPPPPFDSFGDEVRVISTGTRSVMLPAEVPEFERSVWNRVRKVIIQSEDIKAPKRYEAYRAAKAHYDTFIPRQRGRPQAKKAMKWAKARYDYEMRFHNAGIHRDMTPQQLWKVLPRGLNVSGENIDAVASLLGESTKTVKGYAFKVMTGVMYLSPFT